MFGLIPVVGPLLAVIFVLGGVAASNAIVIFPYNVLAGVALIALGF